MIGGMIYYHETLKFYKTHKKEINELLYEMIQSTGLPPEQLFRDWDSEDPLALDTGNQNLLAWFAYEETARNFAQQMGMDV